MSLRIEIDDLPLQEYLSEMPDSLKSRRQWRNEARRNLERQIEILEGGVDPWGRGINNGGALAELRRTLNELNDASAEPAAESPPQPDHPLRTQHLQRDDLKAIFALGVFGLLFLWVAVASSFSYKPRNHFNWGFGRDWTCYNQSLEASCFLKP